MPSNLETFRDLLRELFQLDQADLDFGIYRRIVSVGNGEAACVCP